MADANKPENTELTDADLDQVKGGALLLPAVQQAREAARRKTAEDTGDKYANQEVSY